MHRRILHLDMDAFYASVEQLDNPELRGLPVMIGQDSRGIISTCSYEARRFGVRSAMPVVQARRLCPRGVFLPGRMSRYAEVSRQVMAVLADISPVVEQASIDEAYLDVTGTENLFGPALAVALAGEHPCGKGACLTRRLEEEGVVELWPVLPVAVVAEQDRVAHR